MTVAGTPQPTSLSVSSPAPEQRRGDGQVRRATVRRAGQMVLRVPLLLKLLGANLLIAATALVIHALGADANDPRLISSALAASFLLSALLVRIALRPVDEVTRVAIAIANGESQARAEVLATADRRIAGLAQAFNQLLDRAALDEAQIRRLTRESLSARETEREKLAHHLRESTAQELYALGLHLSATCELNRDESLQGSLDSARSMAGDVTQSVRSLADSVFPGTVGQFGLFPAIAALGRRLEKRTRIRASIDLSATTVPIPHLLQVALYGVAEEALRNVELHSGAKTVHLTQRCDGTLLELAVSDDGRGFDPRAVGDARTGIGLFRARELLAHAGGELKIHSAPGVGTRVVATARLGA